MMLDDFLQECGGVSYKTLEKTAENFGGSTELPPLTVPQELLTSKCPTPPMKLEPVASKGGVRVDWYLGPDLEVLEASLPKYEAQGGWVVEPKHDGMWVMLTVGDPANGVPHQLKSRDAKSGLVGGANAGTLPLEPLPLPPGCIVVGELEAATETSTKVFSKLGYRRLHLFDFPRGPGGDHRHLPWKARRELLEIAHASFDHATHSFPLVPYRTSGFAAAFKEWVAAGAEGLVLKRTDSLYKTPRADGKSDQWHRCKVRVTEDYVLTGLTKTPGGQPTGEWGLFKKGKLERCVQARCPEKLLTKENVGVLVCEFMGWQKMDSGALRHAQWVRVREDKTPAMCVHWAG